MPLRQSGKVNHRSMAARVKSPWREAGFRLDLRKSKPWGMGASRIELGIVPGINSRATRLKPLLERSFLAPAPRLRLDANKAAPMKHAVITSEGIQNGQHTFGADLEIEPTIVSARRRHARSDFDRKRHDAFNHLLPDIGQQVIYC